MRQEARPVMCRPDTFRPLVSLKPGWRSCVRGAALNLALRYHDPTTHKEPCRRDTMLTL